MSIAANIRPEMQALISITRQVLSTLPRHSPGTAQSCPGTVDAKSIFKLHGNTLIDLAGRHHVIPLLFSLLAPCKSSGEISAIGDIPQSILLKNMIFANAARNISLTEKMFDMVRLFKNGNIRAITFKGPAMTQVLYGDISMRQMSDLDFMVHPDDLHSAKTLLEANGFQAQRKLEKEEERIWEETECGYDMSSRSGDLMVDIRSRITPDYLPFRLTAEEVFREQTDCKIEGRDVRTFSMEMQFLLLCYHGAKHLWHRLAWIVDIAMLCQSTRINWNKVFDLAKRSGGMHLLGLGLRITQQVLETTLPENPAEWLARNPARDDLVQLCTTRLYECRPEGSNWLEEYLFYLQMRLSLWERTGYVLKTLFRPTCSDCALVHLSASLSFLYYLSRPMRLLLKVCGYNPNRRRESVEPKPRQVL